MRRAATSPFAGLLAGALVAVSVTAAASPSRRPATVDEISHALTDARNLGHARLQGGRVEMVDRGLFGAEPWMKSGANAWVFQVHDAAGAKMAVRLFKAENPARDRRYEIAQAFLGKRASLRVVPFVFQAQGLKLEREGGPRWEAAMFLDWAGGERLDHHIDKLVAKADRKGLGALATRWRGLMSKLREAGVAHGDLQHGNVFVERGLFHLLDPDALFVPGLEEHPSNELGHRNFQHPEVIGDGARAYGPKMDHFASLLVYLSLRALEADPALWKARASDEALLLCDKDFSDPHASEMLAALAKSESAEVRQLTAALVTALGKPAAETPHLDELLAPVAKRARPAPVAATAPSPSPTSWLSPIVKGEARGDVFTDFAAR